jgi:hypothetical protein
VILKIVPRAAKKCTSVISPAANKVRTLKKINQWQRKKAKAEISTCFIEASKTLLLFYLSTIAA